MCKGCCIQGVVRESEGGRPSSAEMETQRRLKQLNMPELARKYMAPVKRNSARTAVNQSSAEKKYCVRVVLSACLRQVSQGAAEEEAEGGGGD